MGRFTLEGAIHNGVRTLRRMVNPQLVTPDKAIPLTLLRNCEGVAFVTIFKAGLFVLGANVGGGCVIVKVKDDTDPRGWRWSAPSSVACAGLGGGFIFGGEKIDSIILLNTKSAVRAFMGKSQVTFGGNVSLAVGPVGRDIEIHVGVADNKELVAAYSYSCAMGAYIGGTLEGSVLISRPSDNKKYYGDYHACAGNILSGVIPVPLKARVLQDELDMVLNRQGDYASMSPVFPRPTSAVSPYTLSYTQEQGKITNTSAHFSAGVLSQQENSCYHYYQSSPELVTNNPVIKQPPKTMMTNTSAMKVYTDNRSEAETLEEVETFNLRSTYSYKGRTLSQPFKRVFRPPIPRRRPKSMTAVAIYDYSAAQQDELSFRKGEKLLITGKPEQNWYEAKIGMKAGLVPANYVSIA